MATSGETAESAGGARERADHPWLAHYPADVDWAAPIPSAPVPSLLEEAVARFGDRPCIDFYGRVLSYRAVAEQVRRAAAGFQRIGVKKGTRVGLCLPNTPYSIICYYAVLRAGGTVVNLNPLYAERELAALIEDSGAAVLVTVDHARIYPKLAKVADPAQVEQIVVCRMADAMPFLKGWLYRLFRRRDIAAVRDDERIVSFASLIAQDAEPRPVAIDAEADVAVFQYTGGTTGLPKGAMLTHGNLVANTHQLLRWFTQVEEGRERFLVVLPLFHSFAMTVTMNAGVAIGARLTLLPRFDLDELLRTIRRARPTLFLGVPTIYGAIAERPDVGLDDLSSIRACISGGAALPAEIHQRFEAKTGCILLEGYGLTETSPGVTCSRPDARRNGSVGQPLPGTVVEILAPEDGATLPQGERGEICVRGPQVMAGYWNRPEDTEQVLRGGRLHTGDVGYLDAEGFLFLVDRLKDVIVCSGYKVYPRNVEEAIGEHQAVLEVAVIGVPDSYRGESPKAFVQLRRGAALTAEELKDFLRDKLSPMEMPREVEFRDALPKTDIGKIAKKELADGGRQQ